MIKSIPARISALRIAWCTLFFAAGTLSLARADSPVWLRAKGDGFVIYTDGSQKMLTEFGVRYAAFQALFREFFLPTGQTLPPSVLILLDRSSSQRDYLPAQAGGSGTVVNDSTVVDGTALMAVSMSGSRDEAIARAFEFETIWAVRKLGYYAPIWMAQGAGRVMSTLTISRGKCRFDDLSQGYGWDYYLHHTALPWPRFFAISEASPEYTGKTNFGLYHAQALALMDWILLSDSGAQERFARLSRQLVTMPEAEAVQAVMKVPPEKFSQAMEAHFRGRHRRDEFAFDGEKVRAALEIGPADEAEVLIQTANILVAEGKAEKCRQQLTRAQQLAPDRAALKEALARQAFRDGRSDEAVQLYREATTAGSTDPVAYLTSARARLDGASAGGSDRPGSGGPKIKLAVEEIKKAIALNPGDATAYVQLGRAYYVAPEAQEELLADLTEGLTLTVSDWRVRFYRGLLSMRLERTADAKADFQLLMADSHLSENDHQQVQAQLAYLNFGEDQKKVRTLVEEGKFSEARAMTGEAEKLAPDPNAARRYHDLARWIDNEERLSRPQ